jgi:carboxymethylenebutenolidase
MLTKNIKVPLRDGEMGAYLAIPDRTPAGTIIAITLSLDFFKKYLG